MNLHPCNISSGKYFGLLFQLYIRRMWYLYAFPAIALIIAAICITDIRFIFLSLIYVFLISPMLFCLSLINYGLTKESRYSILLSRKIIDERGIEFIFIDDEGNDTSKDLLEWERIKSIMGSQDNLIVILKNSRLRFIAIPYDSFHNKEELTLFIEMARNAKIIVS